MSWLDNSHANDPAYPAPGVGGRWQAPPTADWAVLTAPESSWEVDLTGGTPWDVPDCVVVGAHSAHPQVGQDPDTPSTEGGDRHMTALRDTWT